MYRIKIKGEDYGLKVESVELHVDSEEEAKQWAEKQLTEWGVPEENRSESFELEKLELLLED